ncbi:ABC transporter C family member 12 [Camellia lanceoleosa]|uniref:ABC transporter C family member 12 n=1 Tax=Camellia lanceoleosa TaxID=1840588 RepID=A0ACC0H6K9_9ERIC|nr:ABC transporter C family member 12 [Camellia lanceoleosa]
MKQFSAANKLKKMATTKEFTIQRFRLRSNYYNYMMVLLTAYYTAGPLFRLVMGILALTLEGQTGGLAPFEMVSLIIEAFAWYSMVVMLGVETKVYISCSGGTVDLGSFMLW